MMVRFVLLWGNVGDSAFNPASGGLGSTAGDGARCEIQPKARIFDVDVTQHPGYQGGAYLSAVKQPHITIGQGEGAAGDITRLCGACAART